MWTALQHFDRPALKALQAQGDPVLRGWVALALACRYPDAEERLTALDNWQKRYDRHPAQAKSEVLRSGLLRDYETATIALLAPLSGPLAQAGGALSDGFLAAFFEAQRQRQKPGFAHTENAPGQGQRKDVVLIDTGRYETIEEAYASALASDADLVVGPLEKQQVSRLLSDPTRERPLLTLNLPNPAAAASGAVLQLSLAPEDEVIQLAELAYALGYRRATLLRPAGDWGERMESALLTRWYAQGGAVASAGVYAKRSDYSEVVRSALDLDASSERNRSMRQLFAGALEVQERRRRDLDLVFLLCRNSDEARALKPLIDYHYAGDLPVFTISTADTGSNDPRSNRDLNGVHVLSMPGRLSRPENSETPGLTGSLGALYALGHDAFRIAGKFHTLESAGGTRFAGDTASLSANGNGRLTRELRLAEFNRGTLQAR